LIRRAKSVERRGVELNGAFFEMKKLIDKYYLFIYIIFRYGRDYY